MSRQSLVLTVIVVRERTSGRALGLHPRCIFRSYKVLTKIEVNQLQMKESAEEMQRTEIQMQESAEIQRTEMQRTEKKLLAALQSTAKA